MEEEKTSFITKFRLGWCDSGYFQYIPYIRFPRNIAKKLAWTHATNLHVSVDFKKQNCNNKGNIKIA